MGRIAEQGNQSQAVAVQKKTSDPVLALVESMSNALDTAFPDSKENQDRYRRVMLTALRGDGKLAECLSTTEGRVTLRGAMMQAAQLGLEPGMLGGCYILPFRKSRKLANGQWVKVMIAEFVMGWRGMIDLAHRSDKIDKVWARAVYENDTYQAVFGLSEDLVHIPARGDRGAMTDVYAVAKLANGQTQFDVMNREEVERIRDNHSPSAHSNHSPWNTAFEEMAKKTVIRRLFKSLPVSAKAQRAAFADGQTINMTSDDGGLSYEPIEATIEPNPKVAKPEPAPAQIEAPSPARPPEPPTQDTAREPEPPQEPEGYTSRQRNIRINKVMRLVVEAAKGDEERAKEAVKAYMQATFHHGSSATLSDEQLDVLVNAVSSLSMEDPGDGAMIPRVEWVDAWSPIGEVVDAEWTEEEEEAPVVGTPSLSERAKKAHRDGDQLGVNLFMKEMDATEKERFKQWARKRKAMEAAQ